MTPDKDQAVRGSSLALPFPQLLNVGRFIDLSFLIYKTPLVRHLVRADTKISGVALCLCRRAEGSPLISSSFMFQLITFFLMFLIRSDVSALPWSQVMDQVGKEYRGEVGNLHCPQLL